MRLSLIILVVSSLAFGSDRAKVVIVPFSLGEGASETAANKFTRLLNEELKTRDNVIDVVAAPAIKPPLADKPPPGSGAKKTGASVEAQTALDVGKKALSDLKFEEAVAAMKKGIDLSLADPGTADMPAVLEAHILLGAAAFRVGDEKEATAALFNLARLDPNYQLPSGYPPIFGREFEKAKKKVSKQPKASVWVEGPAGATAFVDGRDLGMVPVQEDNLALGLHYVKVEGSRGERFGRTVEVKSGVAKVKAIFGGKDEKIAAVPSATGGPADPRVGPLLDEGTAVRIGAYAKATGADYAVVGLVYRTGDQQLTAGTALYSVKKQSLAVLPAISFDSDVLTANVEAFKLADAVQEKLGAFSSSSMPIALITKGTVKASNNRGGSGNVGDVAVVTPERRVIKTREPEKAALTPRPDVRALENKSTLVEDEQKPDEPAPGPVVKSGVPVWVWIVAGVAIAAGGGVGAYLGVKEAGRPVTGSVTATW